MAIKISGTTVIDDSRNLVSVGVATIGSGNSSVILNGNSGIARIGSGITINGNTGDINISGILTVGQLRAPIEVTSFSPAIGSSISESSVSLFSPTISITFNQTVGIGSTGFLEIKVGSATTGITNQTLYPSNVTLSNRGTVLSVGIASLPYSNNQIFPVMSSGFVGANGSNFAGINTVGSATTYSFSTRLPQLADAYGGGFLICQSGGQRWIVAPSSTEVSRNFYERLDATTTANANATCGDWFIPSSAGMSNPGFICRNFWDSYVPTFYWTGTPHFGGGFRISMVNGAVNYSGAPSVWCVRAFRCITY
jgi:hypothetical protein